MKLRIGFKNNMYWGELKDEDGMVESATLETTAIGLQKWCLEHNVSRELWLSTKFEDE